MRKTHQKLILGAAVALAALLLAVAPFIGTVTPVSARTDSLYESFDDYDTIVGRKGEQNAIEAMYSFFTVRNNVEISLGEPVGSDTGKSLRIVQKTQAASYFWTNGTKDPDKLDQTGARYVKFYARNLSADERDIIVYITDVTQTDIDMASLPEYADTGKIPESEQEHWGLKWNAPAVIETMAGVKTLVRSSRGLSVSLPAGFEGAVYIPLDAAYLDQPGWWKAENRAWRNDVLDLNRLFAVSFGMHNNTAIDSTKPETYTVFEVDTVSFGSDESIAQFIGQQTAEEAAGAEKIIRPTTDTIAVDYIASTITLPSEMPLSEFVASFALPSGYAVSVTDAFTFTLADNDPVTDGCTALFTDGTANYVYAVSVAKKNTGGNRGCGGSMQTGGFWSVALLVAGALCLRFYKKGECGR